MKAVLLAAGKGTRLKPLTDNIPKVVIPVNGKPVLEYHVEQLPKAKIRDIFINLHHLPEKIKGHFKDGKKWDMNIHYSYEPEILGTAVAVKKLEKDLGYEPFLVVYGDNYLEIEHRNFIEYAEKKGGIGSIIAFEKEDVSGCGILDINSEMLIKNYKEKPEEHEVFSNCVSAGVFYFCKKIFEYIPSWFSDFGYDVLPNVLIREEKLYTYILENKVSGIDNPDSLQKLKSEVEIQNI